MSGTLSGWIALALVPLVAIAGWTLRRFVRGAFARRMRPHFVLGYAALGIALFHVWTSMGNMRGANSTGIWLGTFAIFALGFQALIGANLQSPGTYRAPLRRWHVLTFAAIGAFLAGHVALNSTMASQFARIVGNASVVEHPVGLPFGVAQQGLRILEKAPLAAHSVHSVGGGKVSAGTAPARVAEEPNHPAFVRIDLHAALVHERQGFIATQLPKQHQRGL
jgi:hypothetical protein